MRFLLVQGISPRIGVALQGRGHDAVHVRELEMSQASDAEIVRHAEHEHRVVITEDTDFGGLLVPAARTGPSVILFRDHTGRSAVRIRLLLEALPRFQADLEAGALVVLDDGSARVRRLDES